MSTGLPATSRNNLDSYTLAEHGGMPRTDRAITTYRHPHYRGLGPCNYPAFTPKHHAYMQRTHSGPPRVPDPTDRQVRSLSVLRRA